MHNIPLKGGFILASNHISNLDPPILGISTRRRLHFMAKIELFKHPLVGWWLRQLWAFPVKRGQGDMGALKETLRILKRGNPVLIFPEGTRRQAGEELRAQPGAGFIAIKAKVPVVPVFIQGSDRAMPPGSKFFKRSLVTVTIGKPFNLPEGLTNEQASIYILSQIRSLE